MISQYDDLSGKDADVQNFLKMIKEKNSEKGMEGMLEKMSPTGKRVDNFLDTQDQMMAQNFNNPAGPCNVLLKVVQGDGNDIIQNWDSDIKWVGGSPPTLSTGNGDIDILSFYWDGTNYFGVASLDFS